jgi:hypothetical protein
MVEFRESDKSAKLDLVAVEIEENVDDKVSEWRLCEFEFDGKNGFNGLQSDRASGLDEIVRESPQDCENSSSGLRTGVNYCWFI